MIRRTLLLGAPLLAVAMLLLTPNPSQAWGWRGGWSGGYGYGYTPYYGSWYGYYPYAGWGYTYPSYSYSYYPGYGYAYPSYSYSYPSYGYYRSPAYSSGTASPSSPGPYLTGTTSYQSFYPADSTDTENRVAHVRVQVPPDAEVWIDGQWNRKTQQTGTERNFVTPPLEPNKDYYYEIRARWTDNGRTTDRTKTLPVHAGDRAFLSFTESWDAAPPRTPTPANRPITTPPNNADNGIPSPS